VTSDESRQKAIDQILDELLPRLMEHCDCAQVLVSFPSETRGTAHNFQGAGNWFARQGMAREFVNMDQAQTFATEIARKSE
jgi:hypothetical protein